MPCFNSASERNECQLINPVELSTTWEATSYAAARESPSSLWYPNFHYRIHKSPLLDPIRNQINSVHTTPIPPLQDPSWYYPSTCVLVFLVVPFLSLSYQVSINFFNFAIAISTSRRLGPGTNSSALCTSICLTSLTLCTFNNWEK
jgi:hypothetical protein